MPSDRLDRAVLDPFEEENQPHATPSVSRPVLDYGGKRSATPFWKKVSKFWSAGQTPKSAVGAVHPPQ